jgi:hypothetical protein
MRIGAGQDLRESLQQAERTDGVDLERRHV